MLILIYCMLLVPWVIYIFVNVQLVVLGIHACIYIASTYTTVHGLSTCVNQAHKHYGYNKIAL